MDKDVIMDDEENDKLRVRIMVLEKALKEIVNIANISHGSAAAFYGMMAEKALEREEE
jgi:hypothetical protein|tara:strand:- start:9333 stop:9506 length:174 start_codon:yes stop_codon:yes gene_type:complete